MTHPIYKIKCKEINNLSEANGTDKVYYKYKIVNFLYKKKSDTNNLLITFHGFVNVKTPKPVFRNYKSENVSYNILAISDRFIEEYSSQTLELSWYLSTERHNYNNLYIEIIDFFNNKYKNVLFIGSSGGGFPALVYASYFKKHALISNSQLYLIKYFHFKNFYKVIEGDIYLSECDIEKLTIKYGMPKIAYIYVNENDRHHYIDHFLPFKKFINDNNFSDHYSFINFKGHVPEENKTHHHILYPKTEDEHIVEIFGSMTK
jgi:hypothetical protein